MDLREFVSAALQQVIAGIEDAQAVVEGDGEINPNIWNSQRQDAAKHKILESDGGKWIHLVEFDVAVTVAESTGTKGGIGLVVGPVALGSKGESNAQSSSVSRIKFEVPVAYPKKKRSA